MKALAVFMLVATVLGMSVLLTLVYFLCNVGPEEGKLLEEGGAVEGHLGCIIGSYALWSLYPAVPSVSMLIDHRALLLTAPLLVLLICIVRFKRWHPAFVLFGSLMIACLPYAIGLYALRGNTVLYVVGPWLIVMILGPLYCFATCAVFSVLILWKTRLRPTLQGVAAGNG